jgi:hypothetical protein
MSIDAPVPSSNPKRSRPVLKMAAGATMLAGLVGVGIAAIPSSMLRPEAAPDLRNRTTSPKHAPDSRPAEDVRSDATTSKSADNSEEADPYDYLYLGCNRDYMPPTPVPQVTAVVKTHAARVSQAAPSEPNE